MSDLFKTISFPDEPAEFANADEEIAALEAANADLQARLAEYEGENKRWHSFETVQALAKERDALSKECDVSHREIAIFRAERALWKRRANALLEIAKAAGVIVGGPYQLSTSQGNKWACLVNKKEFDALQSAVETCKRMSEEEDQGEGK